VLRHLRDRIYLVARVAVARVAVAASCLLALGSPAHAQVPVIAEEIPPPTTIVEGLKEDLDRLEKEIEALRVQQDKAADAAEKKKAEEAKKPLFILSGQMQADQIYFGQDQASRDAVGDLQDGAQFRRLRIGGRGSFLEVFEYSLGVDFALANQPSYLDNYIEWRQLPYLQNVRAGHYFEPFSLERVTQNRNNTFMERSLVDTFAPARNMGIMAYGNTEDESATWAIGTFRTNSDNTGNDSFDSGQALTMRGTWVPWWDEASDGRHYLHLGSAYSYRDAAQNQVRFRNTPEIRKQQPTNVFGPVGPPSPSNYQNGVPSPFAPIFVDTGNIRDVDHFQLFDPEFALILGPLSLQAEYAFAAVHRIGQPDLFFNGSMAQVSYKPTITILLLSAVLLACGATGKEKTAADPSDAGKPQAPAKAKEDKGPSAEKATKADKKPACMHCGATCGLAAICVCEPGTKKQPKVEFDVECEPICVARCGSRPWPLERCEAGVGCTNGCEGACRCPAWVRNCKRLKKQTVDEDVPTIKRKVAYICDCCAGRCSDGCSSVKPCRPSSWWKRLCWW
jgi:phosphate-selective porin OprO/OprP